MGTTAQKMRTGLAVMLVVVYVPSYQHAVDKGKRHYVTIPFPFCNERDPLQAHASNRDLASNSDCCEKKNHTSLFGVLTGSRSSLMFIFRALTQVSGDMPGYQHRNDG